MSEAEKQIRAWLAEAENLNKNEDPSKFDYDKFPWPDCGNGSGFTIQTMMLPALEPGEVIALNFTDPKTGEPGYYSAVLVQRHGWWTDADRASISASILEDGEIRCQGYEDPVSCLINSIHEYNG